MLRSIESSISFNPIVSYGQAKKNSLHSKIEENKPYHAANSKNPSIGYQEYSLKQQTSKSYLKPKSSKNFIAANKEKVKGGLLDYARLIKDSPMVMVDKLNSRLGKDLT